MFVVRVHCKSPGIRPGMLQTQGNHAQLPAHQLLPQTHSCHLAQSRALKMVLPLPKGISLLSRVWN